MKDIKWISFTKYRQIIVNGQTKMTMKMKKVAKTIKYKFGINRSVGVSSTYIFSISDIKNRVKTVLKNNGVKNSDEVIKRHEAEIIEPQKIINEIDTKLENYNKETDKLIIDLKDEFRVNMEDDDIEAILRDAKNIRMPHRCGSFNPLSSLPEPKAKIK